MSADRRSRNKTPPATAPANTGARGKASLRRELETAMEQFLRRGGEVRQVPNGASAWHPGTRPPPSRPLFTEPSDQRTPVSDVVARLEARREAMRNKRRITPRKRSERVRRRVIYDDFGEPLRHVWEEE